MKASLIVTVLNEEKSIERLLGSVAEQTRLPDEVVVADGGSKDQTVAKINLFARSHGRLKVKVIQSPGSNRSKGRNLAIKEADHEIIAVTDGGCRLHPDWVAKIIAPFHDKEVQVVAGSYQSVVSGWWWQVAAASASVDFSRVDEENFLPSSRSVAFRKSVWGKVGGYPEYLNTAEDLVFAQRMKAIGGRQVLTKDAVVDWYPPRNLAKITEQFFRYALGDGMAGLESPHARRYLIKTAIFYLLLIAYYLMVISESWFWAVILGGIGWQVVKRGGKTVASKEKTSLRLKWLSGQFAWGLLLWPVTLVGFWIGWFQRLSGGWPELIRGANSFFKLRYV